MPRKIFSWPDFKNRAKEIKLRRAKTMAKSKGNPDFNLEHPDWVRDAQNGKYTDLEVKVSKKIDDAQRISENRRRKRVGLPQI